MNTERCINKKLKIVFIQLSSPNHYGLWNALSVESLAGDLSGVFRNKVNIKVERIFTSDGIASLIKKINLNIDIFAISVELGSLPLAKQLIKSIKMKYSQATRHTPQFVFGNTIPTYMPELFLQLEPKAIVVRGEAEESMRGIVRNMINGTSLENIPSIVYQINGHMKETEWISPSMSSLIYPPSTHTLDRTLTHDGNAIIESSRGCPWSQCSYCSILSGRNGRKWEAFPFKRVTANIERLVEKGINELEFVDADFLGGRKPENIERLYQISSAINSINQSYNIYLSFRIFLTPHILYRKNEKHINRDIYNAIAHLKKVGLSKVYLGIESGCNSQLKRYRKGNDKDVVFHVLKMFRDDLNIPIDLGFLLFDPDLSIDELVESTKFYKRENLINSNQWPFRAVRVTPSTSLFEKLKKEGRLGHFDPNLLCYSYRFKDIRVQKIFDIIDKLSSETRDIFYALKSISKLKFNKSKYHIEAQRAYQLVVDNANIYIELLDFLGNIYQGIEIDEREIVSRANIKINKLIMEVSEEVESGIFTKHKSYLEPKIREYCSHSII